MHGAKITSLKQPKQKLFILKTLMRQHEFENVLKLAGQNVQNCIHLQNLCTVRAAKTVHPTRQHVQNCTVYVHHVLV